MDPHLAGLRAKRSQSNALPDHYSEREADIDKCHAQPLHQEPGHVDRGVRREWEFKPEYLFCLDRSMERHGLVTCPDVVRKAAQSSGLFLVKPPLYCGNPSNSLTTLEIKT